ncbi:GxxExxY protein [Piscinibacter sp.]|uniref:GxxExxY protein n=1 Tax=Piscinibacter sp. TaxID=1903157 RepID=UPI00391F5D27
MSGAEPCTGSNSDGGHREKKKRQGQFRRQHLLTQRIIGCAIEVHRTLGPGLLESACEQCLP